MVERSNKFRLGAVKAQRKVAVVVGCQHAHTNCNKKPTESKVNSIWPQTVRQAPTEPTQPTPIVACGVLTTLTR